MKELIEYTMRPQGATLQAYSDCRASRSFIMGPLGSGKTIETCMKIFDLMCEQEPVKEKHHKYENCRLSRWFAVRNTYSELTSTTIKDWRECHDELGTFRMGSKEPPNQKIDFLLEDGTRVLSEIYFIAFDRPDHIKKARGLQGTGAWLNEIKELPKPVIDMLDLRIGRYPSNKEGQTPTWYGMIGDTNAPDEDHWYYEASEESKPEGWVFHRQPGGLIKVDDNKYDPNPEAENLKNLPVDYYLRGMQNKDKDWIDVNLCNEYGFVKEGKPVHPEFVDSVHVSSDILYPTAGIKIVVGLDFGLTPAAVFMQQQTSGQWIVFDEIVSDRAGIKRLAEYGLRPKMNGEYAGFEFEIWGDPAGDQESQTDQSTCFGILAVANIPAQAAPYQDPEIRREALRSPLSRMIDGKPGLVLSPKCKVVRKGLAGGFCYKRVQISGGERFHNKPNKNKFSHPCEALEYGLVGSGEGKAVVTTPSEHHPEQEQHHLHEQGWMS